MVSVTETELLKRPLTNTLLVQTVLCRQTDCSFGPACSFAHGRAELRTVQQNLAEINPSYKGTLCKYFMATGKCE